MSHLRGSDIWAVSRYKYAAAARLARNINVPDSTVTCVPRPINPTIQYSIFPSFLLNLHYHHRHIVVLRGAADELPDSGVYLLEHLFHRKLARSLD